MFMIRFFCWFFLAFDFCRFCVVIRFFHPRHNSQWPLTSMDFYIRSYSLHYFLILILEKEQPAFPFSILSAKQGNYWYHFFNVFGMTRSWTGDWTRDIPHSMPALYHYAIEEAVYNQMTTLFKYTKLIEYFINTIIGSVY